MLFTYSTHVSDFQELGGRHELFRKFQPAIQPDFHVVVGGNESWYALVLPRWNGPETAKRLLELQFFLASKNHHLLLLTEIELVREPLISNLALLSRHRARGVRHGVWEKVMKLFRAHMPMTFGAAISIFGREPLLTFLAHQFLEFDYRVESLSPETKLDLCHGRLNGLLY